MDELKKKYANVEDEIKKYKEEHIINKMIENKKKELPDFISPVYEGKSIIAYKVSGFPDSNGKSYEEKVFQYPSGNYTSLMGAKRHIKQLEIKKKNESFVEDISVLKKFEKGHVDKNKSGNLPKYIRYYPSPSEKTGYYIEFPIGNNRVRKTYSESNKTMEEKYNLAVNYVKQLYEENVED